MRRRIEVLLGMKKAVRRKVCKSLPIHIVKNKTSSVFIFLIMANKHLFQTSCYLLDSFFSSLPLPPATRSHMARNIIATDLHKTNKRQKKLKPQITQITRIFLKIFSL